MNKFSKILLALLLVITSFGVSPVSAEDGDYVEPSELGVITEVSKKEIQEIADKIYKMIKN